jgi:hypothetical protein
VRGLAATSATHSGSVLKLFDGGTQVASLSVQGLFKNETFVLAGDGVGGTDITLAATPATTARAPSAGLFSQSMAALPGAVPEAVGLAFDHARVDAALRTLGGTRFQS